MKLDIKKYYDEADEYSEKFDKELVEKWGIKEEDLEEFEEFLAEYMIHFMTPGYLSEGISNAKDRDDIFEVYKLPTISDEEYDQRESRHKLWWDAMDILREQYHYHMKVGCWNVGVTNKLTGEFHETQGDVCPGTTVENFVDWLLDDIIEIWDDATYANLSIDYIEYAGIDDPEVFKS